MSNRAIRCPHCGFVAWRYAPTALAAYQRALGMEGPITSAGLAALLGCSVEVAKGHIGRFITAGVIRRVGRRGRPMGGWEAVYELTRRGATHPMTDAAVAVPRGNCGPRVRRVA